MIVILGWASTASLEQVTCHIYPLAVDAQDLGDVEGLVRHLTVLHLDQLIVHCTVLEALYPQATGATRFYIVMRRHDEAHVLARQYLE